MRSRVLGVSPVLVVHPLLRAVDWYRHNLGFSHPQLLGSPPEIAIVERDGFLLYLVSADFEVTITPSGSWDVHLRVEDLEAELQALRDGGVPIAFGPTEIVSGIRKRAFLEVVDPNGYHVCIEQQTWVTGADRHPN